MTESVLLRHSGHSQPFLCSAGAAFTTKCGTGRAALSRILKTQQCALQGQSVPQAPFAAHGRLNFVVFAPVCLFPVLPPARQSANPCCDLVPLSWVQNWRPLTWMKWKAVLLVTIIAPELHLAKSYGQKIASRTDLL